jgi:hypothetical protein
MAKKINRIIVCTNVRSLGANETKVPVDVFAIYGEWAVHKWVSQVKFNADSVPCAVFGSGWVTTHIPSGLSVTPVHFFRLRKSAIALAKALNELGENVIFYRERDPNSVNDHSGWQATHEDAQKIRKIASDILYSENR